jgi:putative DNA primase/helicase
MTNHDQKQTAALRYARAGLSIVPLHGKRKDGRCTCGKVDCDQPGAHPRTPRGIADATKDATAVELMWAKWPKAKICIALGASAELLALVTDNATAQKALYNMATPCGALPPTVTIRYQEKRIRLFRCARRRISNINIAEGVRVLGDGEFVIAPSRVGGRSGKRRFVEHRALDEVKLAQAPAWLFAMRTGLGSDRVDTPQTPVAPARPSSAIVRASDVAPESVDWIWPNTIAAGRVTSLIGHPGHGKSQVAIDIAATISTGRQWPGNVANGTAAKVIILSAQDALADTIVPRLIAAGANLDAVHLVEAVTNAEAAERAFSLAADLGRLENEFDLGSVRLVIVDPASAYLAFPTGKPINRSRGNDVRSVLDRCAGFAARHNLGVLVLAQLNESTGSRAITRAIGSVEWTTVPRAAHLVVSEAESNRRLFLPLKNNLAADRNGYAFEIQEKLIADGIRASAVVWRDDPVTICPDVALAALARGASSGAMAFLREALRDGPQAQREIVQRGAAAGYSEKSLRTALKKLGGISRKEGFGSGGGWLWEIADSAACPAPVANGDADDNTASSKSTAPIGDAPSRAAGSGADKPAADADWPQNNTDLTGTNGPSDTGPAATEGGR